jgi:hypothetical protein
MMRTCGIVVVNRLKRLRESWNIVARRPRPPALPLPVEEIFRRYRGFDGTLWPDGDDLPFVIEDGLAAPEDWGQVEAYLHALVCRADCDPILVARPANVALADPGWLPAGIDVGYLEAEYSRYSVIFHEVVCGLYDEMREFAADLNEHLLLPSPDLARALLDTRTRLLASGADLERGGPEAGLMSVFIRHLG